jgi:hypothetical protein
MMAGCQWLVPAWFTSFDTVECRWSLLEDWMPIIGAFAAGSVTEPALLAFYFSSNTSFVEACACKLAKSMFHRKHLACAGLSWPPALPPCNQFCCVYRLGQRSHGSTVTAKTKQVSQPIRRSSELTSDSHWRGAQR